MSPPETPEQRQAGTINTLVVWASVLTAAMAALLVISIIGFSTASRASGQAGDTARKEAAVAAQVAREARVRASVATSAATKALDQLREVAAQECYRVNYLRWQVDRAEFGSWQRDFRAAVFLNRIKRAFRNRAIVELGRAFRFAARQTDFLPTTDCAAALASPSTYTPPVGIPFNRVPRAELFIALGRPPAPPG